MHRRYFAPDCPLVNKIGCTEVPAICVYLMNKEANIETHVVPVGFEEEGFRILLWDKAGNEVGVNQVGEMVIKSRYLSPGYWRQPELTRVTFLPDPEGGDERLYRMGDLGIRLPDGLILHLGRATSQVKIRGHRVEVAEIEMAMLSLDCIKEVAVAAQEDQYGDQILVGYMVPAKQPASSTSALRRELVQKLPDYMIPSAFVILDALPLTPTGKVDYRALPMPSTTRPDLDSTFKAPRNHTEHLLADIWEKVLGIDAIGVADNFFELGGNSLLAARLIVRTEKVFGKKIPLATIFQRPTVEKLARILNGEEQSIARSSLVLIQTGGSRLPFFCMTSVNNLTALAHYLGPEQPVYGLIPSYLDDLNTSFTVEQIAAECLEEIRALQPEGPYLLGGHSFGGLVAFEMAHQLQALGQRVQLLVLIDTIPSRTKRSFRLCFQGMRYYLKHGRLDILIDFSALKVKKLFLSMLTPEDIHNKLMMVKWKFPSKLKSTRIQTAMDTYTLRAYSGRIVFFEAGGSPVPWRKLQCFQPFRDTRSDWAMVAIGGLEIHQIPGGHASMLDEPNVQMLAEKLRACLDRVKFG